jgi:hypothetical protein
LGWFHPKPALPGGAFPARLSQLLVLEGMNAVIFAKYSGTAPGRVGQGAILRAVVTAHDLPSAGLQKAGYQPAAG